jgi:endonuclease G
VIARSDGDIGYSNAHMDALVFIDAVASELQRPVVVNVSKGMNAGAHDGKSALEIAFDAFSGGGRKPGRVVVKSAGNERSARGHAQLTVSIAEDLRWTRKPQSWPFERIEVWWNSANAYRFRLHSPAGAVTEWASDADPDVHGTLTPGGVYHMHLVKWHPDNGDSLLRIELGDGTGGVTQGEWRLQIVAVEIQADPTMHAWIGRGGGEPSEFEDFVNSDVTLTIPATSDSVIAVAAVEADEQSKLGRFSSRGPTRDGRNKPDVAAPGVDVVAALAGTPRETKAMSGTSMAAPHVAGAVALIMSRAIELERQWPTANQIKAMLTQKTKTVTGRHDVGLGFGIVDIAKLLDAVPSAFPRRT